MRFSGHSVQHRPIRDAVSAHRCHAFAAAAAIVCCLAQLGQEGGRARGQTRLPETTLAAASLQPIYWKQDLFLIPYQWDSAAESGAAQAVWLFVSKDGGATWQKISEAKPQVTAFTYRAEGEGEYWFAIRTVDHQGREWPAGPHQPELRVIVDTTMPQFHGLSARSFEDGWVEIEWRGSDANLDSASFNMEAQMEASDAWHPVAQESLRTIAPDAAHGNTDAVLTGRVMWKPPAGSRPVAIRAKILDLAGNPATYQAQLHPAGPGRISTAATAADSAIRRESIPLQSDGAQPSPGWVSSSAALAPPASAEGSQPWPATPTHQAPFRLWSSAARMPDDGVTTYGNPPIFGLPPMVANGAASDREDHRARARYANNSPARRGSAAGGTAAAGRQAQEASAAPRFSPLEPFREASVTRLPTTAEAERSEDEAPPAGFDAPRHLPPAQPKLVGSRTFALEYDLEDTGRWGVTKVELWGTRDGGQTWRSYARDDDHRSPLVVTVDEEGLYGFRILVESSGSAAQTPEAGDQPELWVAVDLDRPVIELTDLERGEGNLADHLILRWQAADDNLQPRPIALFYSSRPAGPWSAIATSLENTGEYAWRVERHVPSRFYLRLEARDVAGNLAAFQTREPVEFSPAEPKGRLRDAEALGPTAAGDDGGYW